MKARYIAAWVLVLMSLRVSAAPQFAHGGVTSDGGGDARKIAAKPFSDPAKLDRVIRLAQAALGKLPPAFAKLSADASAEIMDLKKTGSYLELPELISRGKGEDPEEGYPSLGDRTHFYSFGAETDFERGAPLFFAKRVLQYSDSELTTLLLHDILHHVLPKGSIGNETFVQDAAAAIMAGKITPALKAGLLHGLVLREKFVSGRSVALWLVEAYIDQARLAGPDRDNWLQISSRLEARLESALPKRLENLTVAELVNQKILSSICGTTNPDYKLYCQGSTSDWTRVHERLFALAKAIDPANPLADPKRYSAMYCKHAVTGDAWVNGDRCARDLLLVSDLFDWKRLSRANER